MWSAIFSFPMEGLSRLREAPLRTQVQTNHPDWTSALLAQPIWARHPHQQRDARLAVEAVERAWGEQTLQGNGQDAPAPD